MGSLSHRCHHVKISLDECHKKIAFDSVYSSATCVSVRYTTKCLFRKINNRSYNRGIRLHCLFSHEASHNKHGVSFLRSKQSTIPFLLFSLGGFSINKAAFILVGGASFCLSLSVLLPVPKKQLPLEFSASAPESCHFKLAGY